jgi:hypothetical protein
MKLSNLSVSEMQNTVTQIIADPRDVTALLIVQKDNPHMAVLSLNPECRMVGWLSKPRKLAMDKPVIASLAEDDGHNFLAVDCGAFHDSCNHECEYPDLTAEVVAGLLATANTDANDEVESLFCTFTTEAAQTFTIYGVTKSYDTAASTSQEQRLQLAVKREFVRLCSNLNVSPVKAALWIQG